MELEAMLAAAPWSGLERLPWTASCAVSLTAYLGMRRPAWLAGAALLLASAAHGNFDARALAFLALFVASTAASARVDTSTRLGRCLAWAQVLLALVAFDHRAPGFSAWQWQPAVTLGSRSTPFVSWLNVDKIFAGSVLLLAARRATPSVPPLVGLRRLGSALPVAAATVILLLGPAVATGYVRPELHLNAYFWTWGLHNLCLVVLHEEVLFRGTLPRLLARAAPRLGSGGVANTVGCALAFGAYHHRGGFLNVALAALAGLGYAAAARRTGGLSGSILANLALNCVHFLSLTYPAVRRGA